MLLGAGLDWTVFLATTPGLDFFITSLSADILDVRNSSLPMSNSWDTANTAYSLRSFTGIFGWSSGLVGANDRLMCRLPAVALQWRKQEIPAACHKIAVVCNALPLLHVLCETCKCWTKPSVSWVLLKNFLISRNSQADRAPSTSDGRQTRWQKFQHKKKTKAQKGERQSKAEMLGVEQRKWCMQRDATRSAKNKREHRCALCNLLGHPSISCSSKEKKWTPISVVLANTKVMQVRPRKSRRQPADDSSYTETYTYESGEGEDGTKDGGDDPDSEDPLKPWRNTTACPSFCRCQRPFVRRNERWST